MDLVEIRKKAKSRKRKEDRQPPIEKEEVEQVVAPPPKDESIPETGAADSDGPERTREEEVDASPAEKEDEDVKEADLPSGSLASLKGVLMSQQEEDEEEEEEQLQLLIFLLGEEEYALNIMDIKEIIRPKEVTEVPKAPDYIQGILSLRGTIIPVMDVNRRLGLPLRESSPENRIVVVKWHEHLFGLLVDGVVQVLNLPLALIEPPPEIIGGVEGEFIRGVGRVDDRLVILLNILKLLALGEEDVPDSKQLVP